MTAAIALNRFGLGARPDEPLPADPRAWLLDQFERYEARPPAWSGQPGSAAIVAAIAAERQELRAMRGDAQEQARRQLRRDGRDHYRAALAARSASALATPTPFVERLVHFWANHFAVSIDKPLVLPLAGAFEAEAIRPQVLGRFEDLLLAALRHPAMLLYLDQAQSIGPDSRLAARVRARAPQRNPGLNENLAREILELHTLGVRSGYTQQDVTELARALTGWSVAGLGRIGASDRAEPGSFVFRAALHEPGSRSILGRAYPQVGEAQARAVLQDLAHAPDTATHLATKLARHFAGDEPPPALVQRLAAAFTRSSGDLATVYRELVDAPQPWVGTPLKFRTPWEWLLGCLRGLGLREPDGVPVAALMQQLGQAVWRPGSPAGYADVAAAWAAPDALLRRVELAARIAARTGARFDARALAPKLLPDGLTPETAAAIARADSRPTALALLLVSPQFLRR